METRHVRLEYGEALDAKKQILSSEMSLLQIIKKARNYRLLRKKEVVLRNKFRVDLSSIKAKINLIFSTFPEEEKHKRKKKEGRKKEKKEKKEFSGDLQKELEEIHRKLEQLG